MQAKDGPRGKDPKISRSSIVKGLLAFVRTENQALQGVSLGRGVLWDLDLADSEGGRECWVENSYAFGQAFMGGMHFFALEDVVYRQSNEQ